MAPLLMLLLQLLLLLLLLCVERLPLVVANSAVSPCCDYVTSRELHTGDGLGMLFPEDCGWLQLQWHLEACKMYSKTWTRKDKSML